MISRTTKSFWRYYDSLPEEVRRLAVRSYVRWNHDPKHPSLHFKCINVKHKAYSVRVGIHWRAVGYRDMIASEEILTWFWIGSHADYDRLIASL